MKSTGDWYKSAATHTADASTIVRQIALACVGAVWIFRTTAGGVPDALKFPLFLVLLGLFLDVVQYVWLGQTMHRLARKHEVAGTTPDGLPVWITNVGFGLWTVKIALVLVATLLIALYVL